MSATFAPARPWAAAEPSPSQHVLSVLVRNQPSVLARISGLFSRRAYNIASLAVGPTENPHISRVTIVVQGDLHVEQVLRQLDKLIDVVAIAELDSARSVSREVMLLSLAVPLAKRPALLDFVQQCRGTVVDITAETITFEVTGTPAHIDAIVAQCCGERGCGDGGRGEAAYQVVALARSGTIALPKTSAGEQAFVTSTGGITVGGADELPALLVSA